MGKPSKIRLSTHERGLLEDVEFFRSKKIITEKIYHQLAELVTAALDERIFSSVIFPPAADAVRGKISKGENYLGYPWIILDFPRLFNNEEVVAIRTMVWWGQLISCSLVVTGELLPNARTRTLQRYEWLAENDCWICVSDSMWHHHFEDDNFRPVKHLKKSEAEELLKRQVFLKLSRKITVRQINNLIPFAMESFRLYAKILAK